MIDDDQVVPVPAEFFTRFLGDIENLAELKVILQVARLSARGANPAVPLERLLKPDSLRTVIAHDSPELAEARLTRALERAVAAGSLLRIIVDGGPCFLVSSPSAREAIEGLRRDDSAARQTLGISELATVALYRPNIFAVYEQSIGPLTPLVAEQLRDAERSYPRGWIEQAMAAAVNYNKRNWRYVQSVLSAWEESGAPDGAIEQHS